MNATSFLAATIRPAATFLAGATGVHTDACGEALTLAIAIQESGLRARTHANGGPAHGW